MAKFFVHETSCIDENVAIGDGTKVWHYSHIQEGASIGKDCVLGQNVNVSNNVVIGDRCKLQNNVSVYEGVMLEDDVFCGPSMVFTNDLRPRAFIKDTTKYGKTVLHKGCSIGANATIVCGHDIGNYAMVAAGAVVTKNVKKFALVAGVPAKQIGWVCQCGNILNKDLKCVKCSKQYRETEFGLEEE